MPLDEDTWRRFATLFGGDDAAIRDMVAVFLEESSTLRQAILDGIAAADAPKIRHAAHTLKSISKQLGGLALSDTCAVIEAAGGSGDVAAAGSHVERFQEQSLAVEKALRQRSGL